MKTYQDFGVYDFSDYAEEITGVDLIKINGGSSSCNGSGPGNGGSPSVPSGSSGNSGSGFSTSGSGSGSAPSSGTGSCGGSISSGTPSGYNPGPTPQISPNIPEEIKSNPYAYAAYMAKQGEAMEKGEGDKYKNYNVLGVGVIDVKAEIIMGEHIYSEYFIKKYVPEQYQASALKALEIEEGQGKYGAPTDCKRVTAFVGEETNLQDRHTGVDIGAIKPGVKGDPIYATADGVVLRNGETGNSKSTRVELSLPYCNDTAIYQHGDFIVSEGESVKRGQVIGYMSDKGTPGQVHLHYEIRQNGLYKDPIVDPLPRMPAIYTPYSKN